MNRAHYLAAIGYITICVAALGLHRARAGAMSYDGDPGATLPVPVDVTSLSGNGWFAQTKPYCNALEAEVRLRSAPPPRTTEGAGYGAACYALAGKIGRAHALIDSLDAAQRGRAADIVFDIGHPVADAGDDQSAGPMMELVLDYRPNNYMALYHAGASEYALGQPDRARTHLRDFLRAYTANDGWTGNARALLQRIEAGQGPADSATR